MKPTVDAVLLAVKQTSSGEPLNRPATVYRYTMDVLRQSTWSDARDRHDFDVRETQDDVLSALTTIWAVSLSTPELIPRRLTAGIHIHGIRSLAAIGTRHGPASIQ